MRNRAQRLAVGAVVILAAVWFLFSAVLPRGGARSVTVNIPRGASAGGVGQTLVQNGLIRSAFGFRLLARLTGRSGDLKPGAYRLNSSMSPAGILNKIASGDVSSRWVTIPEGFTIRQIAERLQTEGLVRADRFIALALGGGIQTQFAHPQGSLEGYLFPDTYLLPVGASEEEIISEMTDCFYRKAVEPLSADFAASDMSMHQIITLASLIEREARVPKDRPLISAVLRNRLRMNMRLQCDATVLYALGAHKDRVLYRDLDVDSPYNTYRNAGLPPGPIANPGLDSIKAALHPASADYLYYVARPDGSHIFSRTMEEHQQARSAARRGGGD